MNVYLSIVAGAIKLLNYMAAALQQHHDEMNGVTAQVNRDNADELAAIRKGDAAAADPAAIGRVRAEYEIDRPA